MLRYLLTYLPKVASGETELLSEYRALNTLYFSEVVVEGE